MADKSTRTYKVEDGVSIVSGGGEAYPVAKGRVTIPIVPGRGWYEDLVDAKILTPVEGTIKPADDSGEGDKGGRKVSDEQIAALCAEAGIASVDLELDVDDPTLPQVKAAIKAAVKAAAAE